MCRCPFQSCRNLYTLHQTATRNTKQVLSVSQLVDKDMNTQQMNVWTSVVDKSATADVFISQNILI